MKRVLAIDYGRKRSGIAVTDPMQIIANGLTTVRSHDLMDFLRQYFAKEQVEAVVIGLPTDMRNNPSEANKWIEPFVNAFRKQFPDMRLVRIDERFTSKMAFQTMIDGGIKKKDRQNKELVDTISATIILQSYLEQKQNGLL